MAANVRPEVADGRYRVEIGEKSFEVEVKGGVVVMDGVPIDYSVEPVGSGTYSLLVDGRSVTATSLPDDGGRLRVLIGGREFPVRVLDEKALLLEQFGVAAGGGAAHREIKAPMPGLVLNVFVAPGQEVKAGAGLLVLEAMKMENELRAPADGIVYAIHVAPGDAVGKNQLLIEFEG